MGEGGSWPALSSPYCRGSSHFLSLSSWFGWKASPRHTKWSGSHLEGAGPACTGALLMFPRCQACGHHLHPDSTLLPLLLHHHLLGHGCKVGLLREASPTNGGPGQLVAVH